MLLAGCVALTHSIEARADDAAEARLHFELGARDAQARRYAAALEHFTAAFRLAPTARTLFNIAQAHDALADEARAPREAGEHRDRAFEAFTAFLARPEHGEGPQGAALTATANAALARLSPRVARVLVRASAPGATVYVDRVELGSYGALPRTIAAPAGEHTLIVRAPGHREVATRVEFREGVTQERDVALAPLLGAVRFELEPGEASVSVDDGPYEPRASGWSVELAPGVHRVSFRRDGYVDATREFELRAEQRLTVRHRLALDPARASVLTIRADRSDATATLGAAALGAANGSRVLVQRGPLELAIRAPGRQPFRTMIALRPGRETQVRVTLGVPGALRPAWQWALLIGGGASLCAGAVVGGAAIAARQAFRFPDASAEQLSRITALNAGADVALSLGVTALASGVIAWLLTEDPARSRAVIVDEGLRER